MGWVWMVGWECGLAWGEECMWVSEDRDGWRWKGWDGNVQGRGECVGVV